MILTKNNWKQSFNAVPDSFCCRVRSTVARLEAAPRRHARLRPAIILAAMLLLLAGTALALSSLGVLDTLTGNLRRFLLPGAARLVQTDISQTAEQPRHAAFTVEQAVNDGHQIYATIRVHGGGGALLMEMCARTGGTVFSSWADAQAVELPPVAQPIDPTLPLSMLAMACLLADILLRRTKAMRR